MCNATKMIQERVLFFFMLHATFLLQVANISMCCTSHSMKSFRETQLLLADHKTCLKHSILERMFDFKNVHQQFYFKNNMAQGKMTDKENKQLLLQAKSHIVG